MEKSFQYKWEESDRIIPSAVHLEKNSTLLFWICLLFVASFGVFFTGYKWKAVSTGEIGAESPQLYSFRIEAFLVRIPSVQSDTALIRVKTKFFVNNIQVQNELIKDKNQYKEHLIFFLSQAKADDFLNQKKKQVLEEKIRNHINSFLSSGKIGRIHIQEQFI